MKLEDIPTEVILCVMDWCDAVTLTQLELVSQFFNTLARDTLARRISSLVGGNGQYGLTLTMRPGGMAEEASGERLYRPHRLSTNKDQEFGWQFVPKYWNRPVAGLEKINPGRDLYAQSRMELGSDECEVLACFAEDMDYQPVQLKVGIELGGGFPIKILDTWTLINKSWGQDGEYLVRHKDLTYKLCVRKMTTTDEQQPAIDSATRMVGRREEMYAVTVSELVLNTAQILDRAEQLLSSRISMTGMAMTPVAS